MKLRPLFLTLFLGGLLLSTSSCDQTPKQAQATADELAVIAYYAGDPEKLDNYAIEKIDQIIYSFLHLKGNKLVLENANDSIGIAQLVSLKKRNPALKILISLGGWGGCETCSDVFSEATAREEFAQSVLDILVQFGADGIDLDWEYPGIAGYPGHAFKAEDKQNFTHLVEALRQKLGAQYIISFAAGGFDSFFTKSVEWEKIMPLLDGVNIMTYDLVSGGSPKTGHHTALYSSKDQSRSADYAVNFLDSLGVPREKMVIGVAFYARVWEEVPDINQGLFQEGKFKEAVTYQGLEEYFEVNPGFELYWDEKAQAPYAYNADSMWFATFDDSLSVSRKTQYVREQKLGGIMFWQLAGDKERRGLLEAIAKKRIE